MDIEDQIISEKITNKVRDRKWLFFVMALVFLISGKCVLAQTPAPISHDINVGAEILPSPLLITIFNINNSNITKNSAIVSWETDVSSRCSFYYGETLSYESGGFTEISDSLNHSVDLSGLKEGTDYFYRLYCYLGTQTGQQSGLSLTTLNGAKNNNDKNNNNNPQNIVKNRGEITENPRPIVDQEYPPYGKIINNRQIPVRSLVQSYFSYWEDLLPLLIVFLLLLLWLFFILLAKRGMGIVVYSDDKIVKRALIEVWDLKNKKLVKSLKADKNGRYRFRLNPGKYNLRFFNPERSQSWKGEVAMQTRDVFKEKIILKKETAAL